ncbi:MAG: glycosyltransferase [Bacteroidia bacterium]
MDLIVLTHRFPFDKGEEFLEKEVPWLSKSFGRVTFLPAGEVSGKPMRKLPANCHGVIPAKPFRSGRPFSLTNIWAIAGIFLRVAGEELRSRQSLKPLGKPAQIKHILKEIGYALNWKAELKAVIGQKQGEAVIIYSYWLDSWLIAAVLLRKEFPGLRIVSRVHGYDLYFERGFLGYQPFRPWLFKHLDGVFPISFTGKKYLEEKFPGQVFKTSYLGTDRQEAENHPSGDGIFRVVSCAMMIPLKRIHLLIEALAQLDFPVEWTHFGDGPLKDELTAQAEKLPGNIEYHFPGNVSNPALMDYYRTHPVDVFVNTSETEGIPVTIMEVISFGIPAIGPDVGGVAEVVDNQYGFLLENNFSPETLAQKIKHLATMDSTETTRRRHIARETFNQKFYAGHNFPAFCREISGNEPIPADTFVHS